MIGKIYKFGKDARDSLLKGVELITRVVVTTLGPKGRNVALDKEWIPPTVIHDGVTIAKEIYVDDPFENMGVQMVKEASSKTNDNAGDGTTTSTLLAYEIAKHGNFAIDAGANPMSLKKGIDQAISLVVNELKKTSIPITSKEQIEQVAIISSQVPEIGKIVAEAMDKVGASGVVTVSEGTGLNIDLDYTEGMEFDKGYISPQFSTNDKQECEIESPYILITDQKISSPVDLVKALKRVTEEAKRQDIVVIADGFDDAVTATLLVNKASGSLNIVGIQAPAFADRKKQILEDLAVLTGGTLISKESNIPLDEIKLEHFGRCEKVWCDKDKSQFIGGLGDKSQIEKRITQIKNAIEKETSDFEKDKLKERVAKLTGGVAIIKVGSHTELEMKENKERAVDAVEATKSAVEEGVVAGGGVALLQARKILLPLLDKKEKKDFIVGIKIVYDALEAPIKKIIENAGADKNIDIVNRVETVNKKDYGYDVETETFGSMFDKGIIDPTKVVRSALQNAASIASIILTTDCLVANPPKNTSPDNA